MKQCSKCKETQELTQFCKDKHKTDGLSSACKSCRVKSTSRWQKANADKVREYQNRWQADNLDKCTGYTRAYREKHSERFATAQAKYRAENPEKINAWSAKYRANRNEATPSWLTAEHYQEISEYYQVAAMLSTVTDISYHVDHIQPLSKGGLHVPWNLDVITARENCKKGNRI